MESRRSARLGAVLLLAAGLCIGPSGVLPAERSMPVREADRQPVGHFDFCLRYPGECDIVPDRQAAEPLTQELRSKLESVNASVNGGVEAADDLELYGLEEYWDYPLSGRGDCEDYVLAKRRLLHRSGISLANLLVTMVRKPDGADHAVLTVRTTGGDYILDNLSSRVARWDETAYLFVKRQSSGHTGSWVRVDAEGSRDPLPRPPDGR